MTSQKSSRSSYRQKSSQLLRLVYYVLTNRVFKSREQALCLTCGVIQRAARRVVVTFFTWLVLRYCESFDRTTCFTAVPREPLFFLMLLPPLSPIMPTFCRTLDRAHSRRGGPLRHRMSHYRAGDTKAAHARSRQQQSVRQSACYHSMPHLSPRPRLRSVLVAQNYDARDRPLCANDEGPREPVAPGHRRRLIDQHAHRDAGGLPESWRTDFAVFGDKSRPTAAEGEATAVRRSSGA